jgi:hypothetical protein
LQASGAESAKAGGCDTQPGNASSDATRGAVETRRDTYKPIHAPGGCGNTTGTQQEHNGNELPDELAAAWARLSDRDRAAILALARSLAGSGR